MAKKKAAAVAVKPEKKQAKVPVALLKSLRQTRTGQYVVNHAKKEIFVDHQKPVHKLCKTIKPGQVDWIVNLTQKEGYSIKIHEVGDPPLTTMSTPASSNGSTEVDALEPPLNGSRGFEHFLHSMLANKIFGGRRMAVPMEVPRKAGMMRPFTLTDLEHFVGRKIADVQFVDRKEESQRTVHKFTKDGKRYAMAYRFCDGKGQHPPHLIVLLEYHGTIESLMEGEVLASIDIGFDGKVEVENYNIGDASPLQTIQVECLGHGGRLKIGIEGLVEYGAVNEL